MIIQSEIMYKDYGSHINHIVVMVTTNIHQINESQHKQQQQQQQQETTLAEASSYFLHFFMSGCFNKRVILYYRDVYHV